MVQALFWVKLLVVAIATSGPLLYFSGDGERKRTRQERGWSFGGSNICVRDYGHEQLNHVKRSEEEKGSIMEKFF